MSMVDNRLLVDDAGASGRNHNQQWSLAQHFFTIAFLALALVLLLSGAQLVSLQQGIAYADSGDWSTYLANNGHQGFNGAETIINASSASHLRQHWMSGGGGPIFSQPAEAHGRIYWGSFDGYEHATDLSGRQVWQHYLGQTTPRCGSRSALGVVSTATVTSASINGTTTSVVVVGGGDDHVYALNTSNGTVIWRTLVGAPSSNTFIWSSPAVYNGSVYIGVASIGDCPVIQGQVFQMNVSNGAIQHTFNVVPNGCIGAGVWGSVTIDAGDGTLYFGTGNPGRCFTHESNAIAVVELRASDLTFMRSWQVPRSDWTKDSDFGSTPTLFQATIHGTIHSMVGVANKNGTYYAFDRAAISDGPWWRANIAGGGNCPECGDGSISPSAWDGTKLYVAGGKTSMNGDSCSGSVRALNPATGAFIWQQCMKEGAVLGAVSVVPGVAAVVAGYHLVLLATASGNPLFTNGSSHFYGAASISKGVLYVGSRGNVYAFGT